MAGWSEILIKDRSIVTLATGRSSGFGCGMGGGRVEAISTPEGVVVEYRNSRGGLEKTFLLKEGRYYRVTRFGLRRVVAPEEETDLAVRAMRLLGQSPKNIERVQPGQAGKLSRVQRHKKDFSDEVYSATNFTVEWQSYHEGPTAANGSIDASYWHGRMASFTWQEGMLAYVYQRGGGNILMVCGSPDWSEYERVIPELKPR
jgi:hypothetical protein